MKCLECKSYRPLEPTKRGTARGFCQKKSYVPYVDYRYGNTKACKKFELKNCDNYEDIAKGDNK